MISLIQTVLPPAILLALADALESGGVSFGKCFVGPISNRPELLRLMWHSDGEGPVSAVICRGALNEPDDALDAVRTFLALWHRRKEL